MGTQRAAIVRITRSVTDLASRTRGLEAGELPRSVESIDFLIPVLAAGAFTSVDITFGPEDEVAKDSLVIAGHDGLFPIDFMVISAYMISDTMARVIFRNIDAVPSVARGGTLTVMAWLL